MNRKSLSILLIVLLIIIVFGLLIFQISQQRSSSILATWQYCETYAIDPKACGE